MTASTIQETYITNRRRVQPHHANTVGTVHGGALIRWMDDVAAMAAMQFAEGPCVTAHIGDITFERPIPVGDIARIEAYVFDTGETSMRLRVRAFYEDATTGEDDLITDSCFTFVALDDDGQPTDVPPVRRETDRGQMLYDQAIDVFN